MHCFNYYLYRVFQLYLALRPCGIRFLLSNMRLALPASYARSCRPWSTSPTTGWLVCHVNRVFGTRASRTFLILLCDCFLRHTSSTAALITIQHIHVHPHTSTCAYFHRADPARSPLNCRQWRHLPPVKQVQRCFSNVSLTSLTRAQTPSTM
jgi:hypothetical protein